jgi:predicted transposase/invertase (TIGR01784 family)
VIKKSNGTKINVELQNVDEKNYRERSVFNCSKIFTGDLKSGQDYAEIPSAICINIVQFDLFTNAECVCTVFPTIQETGETVTEKWKIIYFQTPKLPKSETGGIWDWLKLFTVETKEALISMENSENSFVVKAVEAVKAMNDDDHMREIARIREENLFIEQTALYASKKEGIIDEKYNVARKMIGDGLAYDVISKYTGLSSEALREISS